MFTSLFIKRFNKPSTSLLHPKTLTSFTHNNDAAFTISYLINSCGLSPQSADSISNKLALKTPKKPDAVLSLLTDFGFTKPSISKLVERYPKVLLSKPDKTLLPKLNFLTSLGILSSDLQVTVVSNPCLLRLSLDRHLIPWRNLVKSIVLCDKKVARVLRRCSRVVVGEWPKNLAANVETLRSLGMKEHLISFFLCYYPDTLCRKPKQFGDSVERVLEMEFSFSKCIGVQAIHAVTVITKKRFEDKVAFYMRWGLSRDEAILAFKKFPVCMLYSTEKVGKAMDFLVNGMGWQPADVAKVPVVLGYNLEKWTIPRCSVLKYLLLKGMIKGKRNLGTVMLCSKKRFVNVYINQYQDELPQLLNIFQGKAKLEELGFAFDAKSIAKYENFSL